MADQDDRLDAALRDYYAHSASRADAPDLRDRVMSLATRPSRALRWRAVGGGLATAATAAAVVVLVLANHQHSDHRSPSVVAPAHTSTASPPATVTPASTASPPVTSSPAVAVPVGAPAHGFVPTDVTAVSAGQWWVLGYNGPACTSPSCTRVLHTGDGGATFTSIPVPPVAPAAGAQQPLRLRFSDPSNGWLVSAGGALWVTHDGGTHWVQDSGAGVVTDLEASAGSVYAITCPTGSSCALERSATGGGPWSRLAASGGHGQLSHLTVNGRSIWMALSGNGPPSLLASSDGGQHFGTEQVCQGVAISSVYAVDASVLWASCATGTEAGLFRSVDSGQHFTSVAGPGPLPNFATVAATSSTNVVAAGQALLHSADGGATFVTVENGQLQWSVVGFTTPTDGFAFNLQPSGRFGLWHSSDAGAHWSSVRFP